MKSVMATMMDDIRRVAEDVAPRDPRNREQRRYEFSKHARKEARNQLRRDKEARAPKSPAVVKSMVRDAKTRVYRALKRFQKLGATNASPTKIEEARREVISAQYVFNVLSEQIRFDTRISAGLFTDRSIDAIH